MWWSPFTRFYPFWTNFRFYRLFFYYHWYVFSFYIYFIKVKRIGIHFLLSWIPHPYLPIKWLTNDCFVGCRSSIIVLILDKPIIDDLLLFIRQRQSYFSHIFIIIRHRWLCTLSWFTENFFGPVASCLHALTYSEHALIKICWIMDFTLLKPPLRILFFGLTNFATCIIRCNIASENSNLLLG